MQRCGAALRAVSPQAETVVAKLTVHERHCVKMVMARLLGEGHEQPEGCLNEACADKPTVWITRDLTIPGEVPMVMSRCSRCHMPKSYGRTWDSMALFGRRTGKGKGRQMRCWRQITCCSSAAAVESVGPVSQDGSMIVPASASEARSKQRHAPLRSRP